MSFPESLGVASMPFTEERAAKERAERRDSLSGWQDQLRHLRENRSRSSERIAHLEEQALSSALGLTVTRNRLGLEELGKLETSLLVERRIASVYDASEASVLQRIAELEPLVAGDVVEQERVDVERRQRKAFDFAWYMNAYERRRYLEQLQPADLERFKVAVQRINPAALESLA
jgi:hypothetical protein